MFWIEVFVLSILQRTWNMETSTWLRCSLGMGYTCWNTTTCLDFTLLLVSPQSRKKFGSSVHALRATSSLLRFIEYTIFPPGKNNLIVARFEADKEVYDYAEHLLESSEKTGLKGLREKHNLEPHVTLGKINATKAQVAVLSKNGGPPIPPLDQAAQVFTTDGCYLCGKTPPQAYLDWTFSVR